MLKVLIVDDEPMIIRGLKTLIDWEANECKIITDKCNGRKAYEFLLENKVDVVITDIKMPGMSGLELIERVKKDNVSDADFIILSGYNDFIYTRKAIQLQCTDYLLKPVKDQELITLLNQIKINRKDILDEEDVEKNRIKSVKDILSKEILDKILSAAQFNDLEMIDELMEELQCSLKNSQDPQLTYMKVNYIIFQILYIYRNSEETKVQKEAIEMVNSVMLETDFDKIMTALKQIIVNYANLISKENDNVSYAIIKAVEQDVKDNYADNLSLKSMGEKYYINSAYLGQVFIRKNGKSFKQYLNEYRIKMAVKMLMNTDMKIYEIAEAVGYKSLNYFLDKFLAQMGCTPTKYRSDNQD